MNIKKLDKRYKLYKQGLATHFVDVPMKHFAEIEGKLVSAFGMGANVPTWMKYVTNKRDWFYTSRNVKTKQRIQTGTFTNPWGQPERIYEYRDVDNFQYRVFFRREDQATYFALTCGAIIDET